MVTFDQQKDTFTVLSTKLPGAVFVYRLVNGKRICCGASYIRRKSDMKRLEATTH